jgi:hypothetical protein
MSFPRQCWKDTQGTWCNNECVSEPETPRTHVYSNGYSTDIRTEWETVPLVDFEVYSVRIGQPYPRLPKSREENGRLLVPALTGVTVGVTQLRNFLSCRSIDPAIDRLGVYFRMDVASAKEFELTSSQTSPWTGWKVTRGRRCPCVRVAGATKGEARDSSCQLWLPYGD